MVVGDSISHGFEGDYTWRYRLWQWFQSNNVAVDFVGSYKGTTPLDEPKAPSPPPLPSLELLEDTPLVLTALTQTTFLYGAVRPHKTKIK